MYYSYLNTDQKFINSTLIRSKSELLIITNVILTRLKIKNMYYKKNLKDQMSYFYFTNHKTFC